MFFIAAKISQEQSIVLVVCSSFAQSKKVCLHLKILVNMKKLLLFLTLSIVSLSNYAQSDYNAALGVRGGTGNGVTGKLFISDKAAMEGILFARWAGFNITGLYEIHKAIGGMRGLNFYYGPGAHLGLFPDNGRNPWFKNNNDQGVVIIGVDFIVGIEYNLRDFPINLSADWKPALNLIGHNGFWGDTGGLSIRYLFR
jgi:hypothetical protein